jgi:hypothetical protein
MGDVLANREECAAALHVTVATAATKRARKPPSAPS